MIGALLGPACALGSSFTWAIGTAGYSRLTREHSAFSVNCSRAVVAFTIFLIYACVASAFEGGLHFWSIFFSRFAEIRVSHVAWLGLSMFASYGIGDAMFLWSTRGLGIPAALAIASSYPLWTAIVGVLVLGQRLNALQNLGLVITVIGVIIVILSGSVDGPRVEKGKMLRSILLAFGASFFWCLNSLSVAKGIGDLNIAVGNIVRLLIGFLMSASLGLLFVPKSPVILPTRELRNSLWIFILEGFGGSLFFTYGLSHSPLAIGATLSSLAPAVSVPIAWMTGMEKFSPSRTSGVVLVVLGICLLVGTGSIV